LCRSDLRGPGSDATTKHGSACSGDRQKNGFFQKNSM
jgi:hypothetical protein